jgi:hypothetical protein
MPSNLQHYFYSIFLLFCYPLSGIEKGSCSAVGVNIFRFPPPPQTWVRSHILRRRYSSSRTLRIDRAGAVKHVPGLAYMEYVLNYIIRAVIEPGVYVYPYPYRVRRLRQASRRRSSGYHKKRFYAEHGRRFNHIDG